MPGERLKWPSPHFAKFLESNGIADRIQSIGTEKRAHGSAAKAVADELYGENLKDANGRDRPAENVADAITDDMIRAKFDNIEAKKRASWSQ